MGSSRAVRALLKLWREMYPNLMFIIETKSSNSLIERLRIKLGYVGKLVVESLGHSGGLSLFWSYRITVDLLSYSSCHIDV